MTGRRIVHDGSGTRQLCDYGGSHKHQGRLCVGSAGSASNRMSEPPTASHMNSNAAFMCPPVGKWRMYSPGEPEESSQFFAVLVHGVGLHSPSMRASLVLVALLLVVRLADAGGQHVIPDYATAQRSFFWKLYVNGGKDLYCNVPFVPGQRLTVEHVYAADWIADQFDCTNRKCGHPVYKRAEADLHNLWPALGAINSSRGKKLFGEIPGERRTLPLSMASGSTCDYERTTGREGRDAVVEPRRAVRGDIARSLFYMHVEYELDLKGMLPMLKRWNVADPPNTHERWRNNEIEKLQAIRNRFIDNRALADQLQ
jgi:deoxyribonuclease-1